MKRRPIIGLSITALVLSILFGIASLPDEVLIDSSTIENSQTLPGDVQFVPTMEEISDIVPESVPEKNSDNISTELNALKKELEQLKKELNQLKTGSEIPEEISEISEIEDGELEDLPEGRIISINLNDGVGGSEK